LDHLAVESDHINAVAFGLKMVAPKRLLAKRLLLVRALLINRLEEWGVDPAPQKVGRFFSGCIQHRPYGNQQFLDQVLQIGQCQSARRRAAGFLQVLNVLLYPVQVLDDRGHFWLNAYCHCGLPWPLD